MATVSQDVSYTLLPDVDLRSRHQIPRSAVQKPLPNFPSTRPYFSIIATLYSGTILVMPTLSPRMSRVKSRPTPSLLRWTTMLFPAICRSSQRSAQHHLCPAVGTTFFCQVNEGEVFLNLPLTFWEQSTSMQHPHANAEVAAPDSVEITTWDSLFDQPFLQFGDVRMPPTDPNTIDDVRISTCRCIEID